MRTPGLRLALLAGTTFLMGIAAATAQVDPKLVITGKAAEDIGEMNMINGATAEAISHACEKMAAEHNQSTVIVILDNFGNVVHQHRTDGSARYTAVSTAAMKARTAQITRRPTSIRQYNIDAHPEELAREYALGFFPVSGGLPIWAGKQIIGFIGVGGQSVSPTWSDEICAWQALTQVVGPQPPLVVPPKKP